MRIRFVPKKVDKSWRVYDTFVGSFPYQRPDLGLVRQDVEEAEAVQEAERLNALGISTEKHWQACRTLSSKKYGVHDESDDD